MAIEQTLDQAIGDAAEELLKEAGKQAPPEDDKVDESDKVDDKDNSDNNQDSQDDLDENALKEAKYLYKLLQDKEQAPALIAALAQQVGILKPENLPTTQKETVKAAKSIAEQVVEGLGEKYKFMSSDLGAVIEKVLETKIEEVRGEHQAHISQVEQDKLVAETESVRAKLNKETNGNFDKLEPKMMKLMDEFLPSQKQSVESYLRGIYALAAQGSFKASAEKNLNDKIRKNANDVTSRVSSAGTSGLDSVRLPKPGIKNAVEFALKQLEEQARK